MKDGTSFLKVIIIQNNPVYKNIQQNIKNLTEMLKNY